MMRTTRTRNFFGKIIVNGVNSSKTMIQNDCLMRLYDADVELKNISSELDSFDGKKDPIRCNLLVNRLRTSQDKVISLLFQLMDECNCERASRDYRMKFPDEILLSEGSESLNGQIWFGAECLSAGSNILNHTKESTMLRPMARTLTAHLDALRNDLRDLVHSDGATSINRSLIDKMSTFDQIFAEFEYKYVSIMLPIRTVSEIEKLQEVAVLFSETLIDCVKRGLIKQIDIDEFQPIVMIAIPRLAIVRGLLYKNENPIYTRRKSNMCSIFQPFHGALHSIRKLLRKFNSHELFILEKMLCDDQTAIENPETSYANNKQKQASTSDSVTANQSEQNAEERQQGDANQEFGDCANEGGSSGVSNDNYANILMNGLSYPVGQKLNPDNEGTINETSSTTASPSKFCDYDSIADHDKPCSSSKLTASSEHSPSRVNVIELSNHEDTSNSEASPPTTSSSVASSVGSQRNNRESMLDNCIPSSSQLSGDSALQNNESSTTSCHYDSDLQLARLIEEFGPAMTDQEYAAISSQQQHNNQIITGDETTKTPSKSIEQEHTACDNEEILVTKSSEQPTIEQEQGPAPAIITPNNKQDKQSEDERAALEELFAKQTHQSLHKLFVAISGVADQLQSNFASDLRFILRHIFISEIEGSTTTESDHEEDDDADDHIGGNHSETVGGELSDNRDSCDSDNDNSEGSLMIEPAIEADESTNMSDLNSTYLQMDNNFSDVEVGVIHELSSNSDHHRNHHHHNYNHRNHHHHHHIHNRQQEHYQHHHHNNNSESLITSNFPALTSTATASTYGRLNAATDNNIVSSQQQLVIQDPFQSILHDSSNLDSSPAIVSHQEIEDDAIEDYNRQVVNQSEIYPSGSRVRGGYRNTSNTTQVSPNELSPMDEQQLQMIIQQQQRQIRDLSRATQLASSRSWMGDQQQQQQQQLLQQSMSSHHLDPNVTVNNDNNNIMDRMNAIDSNQHQVNNAAAAANGDVIIGAGNPQSANVVDVERRSRHNHHRHSHNHDGGGSRSSRSVRQRNPPIWVPDQLVVACTSCQSPFTWFRRRHHCRACGQIFCTECSKFKKNLTHWGYREPVRVCEPCFNQS